ncbi:MAG TPA: SIMPL domain-containing protein [Candidatus Paceibacterota bacterium]|nr:SIMPL domain-containing protein [Candidatus Paceibacterota bacterium]
MNFRGLYDYTQPLVAASTVLVVGLLLSVGFGAFTAYKIKTATNTIEVTGSAKESVVADFARWTINLSTKTSLGDQQSGLDRLDRAQKNIVAYLKSQGIDSVETPAPNVNPEYSYPEKSAPILTDYAVSRQIVVTSSDVAKISSLAGNIAPLTGTSYEVTTNGLELTYAGLAEKRVTLLSGAIRDAKARAEAIAKETGRSVGTLRSATGGVVQVLPQGGVDISDYGSYDTQSMNKDVMVTVRATFSIK